MRLRSGGEFAAVYRLRLTASDERLLVYGRLNDLDFARLGLSVSRKVGNAVVRNRWKRLIREAFRLTQDRLPSGIDLVIIPRAAEPPTLAEVQTSLVRLAGDIRRRCDRRRGEPKKSPPPGDAPNARREATS